MAGGPNANKGTYLSLIEYSDSFPYDAKSAEAYYQLFLPDDDAPHGYLLPETVEKMPWTSQFRVSHSQPRSVTVLDSSGGRDVPGAVNAAFQELVDICIEQNLFHILDGKHSEPFAILGARQPVHVERFAAALFGIACRGAYITAYTRAAGGDGAMRLWIARRAAHLYTGAGMLDGTVAGGIKAGASPLETVVREADEEASLPEALVRARAGSAGVVTYIGVTGPDFPGEKGLVIPLVNYVHDLELPADVVPAPNDDEVERFYCMSVDEVRAALLNGEFKADSAVVLVDFFIRHGIITPDNDKDFVEMTMRIHRRLPFRLP
ncbi:NUDIX hydrolase domain-like protein [Hypoxylon sp. FL1284]|nr:NUDIX hydrolase domain-like protein [Hypoxylon sp. FL1284]